MNIKGLVSSLLLLFLFACNNKNSNRDLFIERNESSRIHEFEFYHITYREGSGYYIMDFDDSNNRLIFWKEDKVYVKLINYSNDKIMSEKMEIENLSNSRLSEISSDLTLSKLQCITDFIFKNNLKTADYRDSPKRIYFEGFDFNNVIYLFNLRDSIELNNVFMLKDHWYIFNTDN